MKRYLILASILLFGAGPVAASRTPEDWFEMGAVGRLTFEDPDGTRRLCTGFVAHKFEKTYALSRYGFTGSTIVADAYYVFTAGHCAKDNKRFEFAPADSRQTRWFGLNVVAMVVGGPGYDFAVLEAVESPYTTKKYPTLDLDFGYEARLGDKVLAVGYGRKALYPRVNTVLGVGEDGQIVIDGYASQGNSGGPVILLETGKVIGLMTHTTIDVRVSPTMCDLVGCGVKPPYYATPIARLKGTVKMP